MAQINKILEYLKQGYSLTPIQALHLFGCFRLGARIWDIKNGKCDGIKHDVRDRGKKHSEYYLVVE